MRVMIRPNATVSNNIPGGGEVGGDGTAHGVISDSNMKSYLRSVHSAAGTLTRVGYGTYTLESNQRLAGIRSKAIIGHSIPLGVWFSINNSSAMTFGFWTTIPFPSVLSPLVYREGPWHYKNPVGGVEWNQAAIDAFEHYINWLNPAGNHDARVHELAIELWVLERPVTTNIAPANNGIAQTNTPKFTWSFFQADNFKSPKQVGFELKVWTKAVAEDIAFNPETSAHVVRAVKPGVSNNFFDLANSGLPELTYGAEYYWGVKAYNLFSNGSSWYSDWSEPTPFKVNSPPTTVVTAPVGSITTSNQPDIAWTYTDPDGEALQDRYEVRVWERPGASWAGFDPDTTAISPVFQKTVIGDETTQTIDIRLNNLGIYRAYVRTAQAVQDFPPYIFGAWDFEDFTINLTQPATPGLQAFYDQSEYVGLLVTPNTPGTPSIEHFEVERSLDNGLTWHNFRYGGSAENLSNAFLWGAGAPFSLVDHEVPYGVYVKYRAFGVDTTLGTKVYSPSSTVVTAIVNPQAIWIKNPVDSTMNAKFPVQDSWINFNRPKARSVYQALGRELPIVVRGTSAGRSFTLSFLVVGAEMFEKLSALIEANTTLFLQTPSWSGYADISGDIDEASHLWDDRAGEDNVWTCSIPFTEVIF